MRQKAVMFANTAMRIMPPASHHMLPVIPVSMAVTAVTTTRSGRYINPTLHSMSKPSARART